MSFPVSIKMLIIPKRKLNDVKCYLFSHAETEEKDMPMILLFNKLGRGKDIF